MLDFHMEDFLDGTPIDGRIRLTDEPEESMVICTPFPKNGHFYYNQKINCLRASGTVTAAETAVVAPTSRMSDADVDNFVQLRQALEKFAEVLQKAAS